MMTPRPLPPRLPSRPSPRSIGGPARLGGLLALLLVLSCSTGSPDPADSGQEDPANAVGSTPLRDDFKGRWFNFNIEPLEPFLFESDSSGFYTINAPGSRLAYFGTETLERTLDVPMGPGLTAIVPRPGGPELWCVDSLTSSVGVFDRSTGRLERTIQVGSEPHGLVFSADGDRAYVTCSQADRVDVIETATYSVAMSIPVPARLPRGIVRVGDTVYVVPMRSGNATAPRGNPTTGDALDVRSVVHVNSIPGATPLPDRDLFAIPITGSAATDAIDADATVSGVGTNLYNVHVRPGTSELWIPHTDALNGSRRGEASFIGGQVVRNRITIVDTATGTRRFVNLDTLAPNPEARVATPTGVGFSPDGSRAFVAGFGSSRVAVLDVADESISWAGVIRVSSLRPGPAVAGSPGHAGAGPRSVAVSPNGEVLVIHNDGENTLSRVRLADLPSATPFDLTLPQPVWLGWDPTPLVMLQGRIDFHRTDNSLSKTSSCGSCHVDGHTDGLAWDLSTYLDPEGTPADQLRFPVDDKGPLVTQSVRRLREVGPYHWRGERPRLKIFDGAFVGLLERVEEGQPDTLGPNFNYLQRYMEVLAIRPNPLQEPDRSLTPAQQEGLDLFSNKPVLDGLRCIDCHTLPLGTSGAILPNGRPGAAPTTVVPSLRGVADKQGRPTDLGEWFGERSELGAGLGHDGAFADLESFLLQQRPAPHGGQRFDLSAAEVASLVAYLEAFDTGLAPATMRQLTVRSTQVPAGLTELLEQAQAGHCDVVFRYGPTAPDGELRYATGLYDPGLDAFLRPSEQLAPLSLSELLDRTDEWPITFLGTPVWSGVPMGLDRDVDGVWDLDELSLGTGFENMDTDGDGFLDGHERTWGMDPLVEDTDSPDHVAPDWIAPPTVVYANQNTIKIEFRTNEPVRLSITVDGGSVVARRPLKPRLDDRFSVVINELEPGRTYSLGLHMVDNADNPRTRTFSASTRAALDQRLVLVEEIDLDIRRDSNGGSPHLHAAVRLTTDAHEVPEIGYNLVASVYHTSDAGVTEVADAAQTWLVFPDGTAHFYVPIPPGLSGGELLFAVQHIDAPPGAPIHAVGMDEAQPARIPY